MATTSRTRLSKEARRSQLLDLGVRLFATRNLHDINVDLLAETAGISRGLLYHYFGNIVGFQEAVVRRAADDLIAATAPPPDGDLLTRLTTSLAAYIDFVDETYEGYLSMLKGAKSGNATMAAIYEDARSALTDRILVEGGSELVPDTAAARLVVLGWQAMTEEMVLAWRGGHPELSRDELLGLLAATLPALVSVLEPASASASGSAAGSAASSTAGTGPQGGPEGG